MVFYRQKVQFKESSFGVLRQCFLTMLVVNKHFDAGARRGAIELWRAKVPQRAITKQGQPGQPSQPHCQADEGQWSSNQADRGHPGDHGNQAAEDSNADSFSVEDEDPRAGGYQCQNHPEGLQSNSQDALQGDEEEGPPD